MKPRYIKVDNITFRYYNQGSDMLRDNENLGLAHLTIPGPIADRFRRECGLLENGYEIARKIYSFPHYDSSQMDDISVGSDHDCYNADTQIVLMKHLFDKKRKYRLDYYGLDPFWIFHDSFHAKNDVYSYEVNNIYSYVEMERLLQGAEFGQSKGINIRPETVAKLDENWNIRWRRESGSMTPFKLTDFKHLMSSRAWNQLQFMVEMGTFANNY